MREWMTLFVTAGCSAAVVFWLHKRKTEPILDPSNEPPETRQVPSPSHRVHILFGSQTGTGETFARELAEEASGDFGLSVNNAGSPESVDSVKNWSEFLTNNHQPLFLVLLLSTYGEGDPSDDAVELDSFLSSSNDVEFPNVRYAIFGLGNKQYALFNAMAKRVNKNLQRLGAVRVCPIGLGDDNADIESDFQVWKNDVFWGKWLGDCFGINAVTARENRVPRDPRDKILLELKMAEKRGQLSFDATVHSGGSDVLSRAFFAANIVPIVAVKHLCDGKTQVDVDITKVPSLRYRTGDTLEVLPMNKQEDVDWLMGIYGVSGETFLTFLKKKGIAKLTVKKPFPTPCTVQQALSRYVDLSGRPSRVLVRDLAVLTGASMEEANEMAERIRSKDGVYTVRNLLGIFPGIADKVSLGELIQILPKQKMRAYSICSSPLVDPKKISLVVSRVDDAGLASVFLSDTVEVNDTLLVNLRQGTFRLPTLPGQPVIMICAGTGFAPFRAFIAELKLKNRIAKDKTVLFFGCRNKSEWIYRDEMQEFESLGGGLFVALSREEPKEYVQDKIKANLSLVGDLVNKRNAIVYVCGSTGMGLSVMNVISSVASIEDLRTEKWYIEELWG